tara:strand:- start:3929 stop:4093 length:165 start_codon:yes stop_codon:yes gene_type:complete
MTEREPTLEPEFKSFKDGVYDAIIHGLHKGWRDHYYKRGYDFGMTIYSDMEGEE